MKDKRIKDKTVERGRYRLRKLERNAATGGGGGATVAYVDAGDATTASAAAAALAAHVAAADPHPTYLTVTEGDAAYDALGSAAAAASYADGKVIDSIADSDTTHAPSRNAVFDALALKQDVDAQLTSIADLTYGSNALKVIRVNAGETGFELAEVSGGSVDVITKAYTQTAHGFSVGMSICMTSAGWAQADADAVTTMTDAIVSAVAGADDFTATQLGLVTLTTGQWDSRTGGSGGLVKGDIYYTSATVGGLTNTPPTNGNFQVVGRAESTTVLRVMIGDVFTVSAYAGGGVIVTVAGAAATTFPSQVVDLLADGTYCFEIIAKNATASDSQFNPEFNGDTTITNYRRGYTACTTGSPTTSRGNDYYTGVMPASSVVTIKGELTLDGNGKARLEFSSSEGDTTALATRYGTIVYQTAANVTGWLWRVSVASSIAVGSTWRIWKKRQ